MLVVSRVMTHKLTTNQPNKYRHTHTNLQISAKESLKVYITYHQQLVDYNITF